VKNPDGTADGACTPWFTITGRTGQTAATLVQPDFATQLSTTTYLPDSTPTFVSRAHRADPVCWHPAEPGEQHHAETGAGIRAGRTFTCVTHDHRYDQQQRNDGTIARSGRAEQVLLSSRVRPTTSKMGIPTVFQTEREEIASCQFATVPNDVTKTWNATTTVEV